MGTQRTILDSVEMKPVEKWTHPAIGEGDLPYVTHEGILEISGFTMHVFQFNNGQRIIPCEDVEAFFDAMAGRVSAKEGE